jgi:hypothetical protein
VTPGLVLSAPAGFNATGGGMRGTGTNIILVTQDAPVSFLMDEFVLSHVTSQFLTLFDVQQVEVYRGPQGTLFGKNTTGGVISITSKKPVHRRVQRRDRALVRHLREWRQRDVAQGRREPADQRHAGIPLRGHLRQVGWLLHGRQDERIVPRQRAAVWRDRHSRGDAAA